MLLSGPQDKVWSAEPKFRAVWCEPGSDFDRLPGAQIWDALMDEHQIPDDLPVIVRPPVYAPNELNEKLTWAKSMVEQCGGVLLHASDSTAWAQHGLLAEDASSSWQAVSYGHIGEVSLGAYGSPFDTSYRLYAVNVPRFSLPRRTQHNKSHQLTIAPGSKAYDPGVFASVDLAVANHKYRYPLADVEGVLPGPLCVQLAMQVVDKEEPDYSGLVLELALRRRRVYELSEDIGLVTWLQPSVHGFTID